MNSEQQNMVLFQEIETMRSILNSLAEGVIVANQEGKFIFFNPVAEKILGIGSRDVEVEDLTSVYGAYRTDKTTPYDPEDLPLARAIRGEEVIEEVIFIRNPGQPDGVWISVSSSPVFDSSGSMQGGVVIFRDITERQRALEKISLYSKVDQKVVDVTLSQESQTYLSFFSQFRRKYELFANAVEQTADSILLTNTEGIIQYVNPGFEATTGYSFSEVVGKTPRILKSGHHGQDYYKNLWDQINQGNHYRATVLNKKKNGDLFWAEQTITPIRDRDGDITNFVSVLKDITELKKKQEQDIQLNLAREVQQRLYPEAINIPGFDIAGATYPADETGGDYFDYIVSPDGVIWIAIGDVSGHGIASALVMAETRAYLRSFTKLLKSPGDVLYEVNQELTSDKGQERYVTMILARLNPADSSLTYANAGHVPGYLIRDSSEILEVMKNTSLPLGVMKETEFPSCKPIMLSSGNMVALFTDGIVEAIDRDNNEFGYERLIETIEHHSQLSAQEIVEHLYHSVRTFAGDQPLEDDATSIILKVITVK
ncbi:MAG: SpoIIE family protein phosphatase [Anaerolineales bacterium]|nr:SpoIIE family protein phosphatase [Anaerolineales bacterium]